MHPLYRPPPTTSTIPSLYSAPAPTVTYTLSLHDALPIWFGHPDSSYLPLRGALPPFPRVSPRPISPRWVPPSAAKSRSEEHTSELQSPYDLVCRLLLEKKKVKTGPRIRGRRAHLALGLFI